tara:strand:- start:372 stop:1409 length:1038 start_codon:yes stop_codon:yes gene_type:complete
MKYKVLIIGDTWNGSDCTGLGRGFRDAGCLVVHIGEDQFFPKVRNNLPSKIFLKFFNFFFKNNLNHNISNLHKISKPEIVVVFKGNHLSVETLKQIKKNSWVVNFYPDISLTNHSSLDVKTFYEYDHIYSTKSFAIKDYNENMGIKNVSFLPHGYDEYVHSPVSKKYMKIWHNDVSFIGTWSKNKEKKLNALKKTLPNINLKIWGNGWEKSSSRYLKESIMGYPVNGDLYALAINCSKINLGLLQEKASGASSGDLTTARSFHIPGSGGFMLHERSNEILSFYDEDKEISCFSSSDELVSKIEFYLKHDDKREEIAKHGYLRCTKENKHKNRAELILKDFEKRTV